MHLVGAKVRFIKSPFIVESLIQSAIAVIIVYFSTTYIIEVLNRNTIINSFLSYPVQMHRFHLHLLASCAFLMSWFGAWISVRKYLKFNH
jgi:cell division protein FtsX